MQITGDYVFFHWKWNITIISDETESNSMVGLHDNVLRANKFLIISKEDKFNWIKPTNPVVFGATAAVSGGRLRMQQ